MVEYWTGPSSVELRPGTSHARLLRILDRLHRNFRRVFRCGSKDFAEPFAPLVGDKVDLECASLSLSLVLLAVSMAEDVELDVFKPDAVIGFALEPSRRRRLMGY